MTEIAGSIIVETAKPNSKWLVLVHGVSQDHRIFDAQVEYFAESYQILLIDLPGHGVSSAIPAPYGLSEFADHIRTRMSASGVQDAIFWGTHLGASAGMLVACDMPELFSALVLESPVFPGRALPSVANLLSEVALTANRRGMKEARELWWEKGPWFDLMRLDPVKYRAAAHQRIIADFEGGPWLETDLVSKPLDSVETKLQQLSIPTILLNGEHDVADFIQVADAMEALIPNTYRISVPGGGGFPLWELPDLVNDRVSKVLNEVFDTQQC